MQGACVWKIHLNLIPLFYRLGNWAREKKLIKLILEFRFSGSCSVQGIHFSMMIWHPNFNRIWRIKLIISLSNEVFFRDFTQVRLIACFEKPFSERRKTGAQLSFISLDNIYLVFIGLWFRETSKDE